MHTIPSKNIHFSRKTCQSDVMVPMSTAASWRSRGCGLPSTKPTTMLRAPLTECSSHHLQVLVIIWPIGMVILYIALLIPCRFIILDENQEYHRLLDATAFLHRDYKPEFYFWEVVSLMQRNTLNGWLLLIDIDLQFIRLLTALIISILFLVWGLREHLPSITNVP